MTERSFSDAAFDALTDVLVRVDRKAFNEWTPTQQHEAFDWTEAVSDAVRAQRNVPEPPKHVRGWLRGAQSTLDWRHFVDRPVVETKPKQLSMFGD